MREPIDDPDLRRRVTTYLAEQQEITIRFHQARTSEDRDAALNDLITHADTHRRRRGLVETAALAGSHAQREPEPDSNQYPLITGGVTVSSPDVDHDPNSGPNSGGRERTQYR
jgi:hypothetical protein